MSIQSAYRQGQAMKENGATTFRAAIDAMSSAELDRFDAMTFVEKVAFEAGLVGAEAPYMVTGWRYGDVPATGRSFNGRDNMAEAGVSVMAIDDGSATKDAVSAMFIAAGRPVVRVRGYLNTVSRGADGEPLLLDCETI